MDVSETKAIPTEEIDFGATLPQVLPLSPESLERRTSTVIQNELPSQTKTFFIITGLSLLMLSIVDTLGIAFQTVKNPKFLPTQYFEEYSNPLNFSVLLSLVSAFALLYTVLTFGEDTEGMRRIYSVVKAAMDYWPPIVALGFALELQSTFGLYFPGMLTSHSSDGSFKDEFLSTLPNASEGWIPSAALSPTVLTCILFILLVRVAVIAQNGRITPPGETKMTINHFKTAIDETEQKINKLLSGELANFSLGTARDYLRESYTKELPRNDRARKINWPSLFFLFVALLCFGYYYAATMQLVDPDKSGRLSAPQFLLTLASILFLWCHAFSSARFIRIALSFRSAYLPLSTIAICALRTVFFQLANLVFAFSLIVQLKFMKLGDTTRDIQVEGALLLFVHSVLIITAGAALFVSPREHTCAKRATGKLYLDALSSKFSNRYYYASQVQKLEREGPDPRKVDTSRVGPIVPSV